MQDQRVSFVVRADAGECLSVLCREFSISRPTGYHWLRRFKESGVSGLEDRSRRPVRTPGRTAAVVEEKIVQLRRARPDWGARKLAELLARDGIRMPILTVHRVLERHGLVLDQGARRQATGRFERSRPNELWQMDFKGQKGTAARTGPLSVMDDHSRYLVALEQTGTTRGDAVQACLEAVFEANGLPEELLMDHGVPWWNARSPGGWTKLAVWLMQLGVSLRFSGIRHPQTQGKVERMHGALERARSRPGGNRWLDQSWLDEFREEYNQVRPHEALGMRTPASAWQPSPRIFQPILKRWDYGQGAELRKVGGQGHIYIADKPWKISQALATETV